MHTCMHAVCMHACMHPLLFAIVVSLSDCQTLIGHTATCRLLKWLTQKLGPTDCRWQLSISCRQSPVVTWSSVASSRTPQRMSTTYIPTIQDHTRSDRALFINATATATTAKRPWCASSAVWITVKWRIVSPERVKGQLYIATFMLILCSNDVVILLLFILYTLVHIHIVVMWYYYMSYVYCTLPAKFFPLFPFYAEICSPGSSLSKEVGGGRVGRLLDMWRKCPPLVFFIN